MPLPQPIRDILGYLFSLDILGYLFSLESSDMVPSLTAF